jgi:hypothetical protein
MQIVLIVPYLFDMGELTRRNSTKDDLGVSCDGYRNGHFDGWSEPHDSGGELKDTVMIFGR